MARPVKKIDLTELEKLYGMQCTDREVAAYLGIRHRATIVDRECANVGDVNLHAVAVELDLMDPVLAARHFFDICRKGRFDEAGIRRLDANRDLALKCHALLAA